MKREIRRHETRQLEQNTTTSKTFCTLAPLHLARDASRQSSLRPNVSVHVQVDADGPSSFRAIMPLWGWSSA